MVATQKINLLTLVSYSLLQTVFSWDIPFRHNSLQNITGSRQTDDALDHTVWKYAHGLRQESPSVPSSTDHWSIRAEIRPKAAVSVAVVAKPEVEIWQWLKKSTFWPSLLFTPSDCLWLGCTILPQYKTSQTDHRETDDTLCHRRDR